MSASMRIAAFSLELEKAQLLRAQLRKKVEETLTYAETPDVPRRTPAP